MSQPMFPLGVTAVMLPQLDFDRQLALCTQLGITHYSWRPRVIAADQRDKPHNPWGRHEFDLTPTRLIDEGPRLRRQLEAAGLVSFGTVPACNSAASDDELKQHFEGSAIVGAGRVRISPAPYPQGAFDYGDLLTSTIERYRQVVAIARSFGQKIVLETHSGSFVSSPALALNICRHFDPTDIGVIFDINNFMIEGGLKPNLAVAVIGKYIDHAHVGGALCTFGQRDELGFRQPAHEMCSLLDGGSHVPTWVRAMHEAGVHAPLVIENFSVHADNGQLLTESAQQLQAVMKTLA